MDPKVHLLLEKAKVLADKTGKAATRAADVAGKKANEMAKATRLNLQVFDLNTECDVLYKQIGRMVYDAHLGVETPEGELEELVAAVDENRRQVQQLKQELSEMKTTAACPTCGQSCDKSDVFCSGCGAQL